MNVAVLASGTGTNLQALLAAATKGELGPARITVVGVNVPGCGALARAAAARVPTFVLSHKDFPSREAFDAALADRLCQHQIELVALAGFMRLLTPGFLGAFPQRVINIHPALLPAFPGVHAWKQAYDHGVKVAGCTVHFVDAGMDTGSIIAQTPVAVLPGDTEDSLRQRILAEEHRLYPAVVRAFAEGRVTVTDRRVQIR